MTGTYYEQPFLNHLIDAIVLCELAESLPHLAVSRHAALARGSVIASIFSLEAAANALMVPIQFPQRLKELIDQAQVLDKFEFVLQAVQPTKQFNRAVRNPQEVRELFEIRNQFVHPRTRERMISHQQLGDGVITIQKTDKRIPHLGIPASPEDWGARDALRVLRAASDFLDYFIFELCELKDEEVSALLLSQISIEEKSRPLLSDGHRAIFQGALSRWPIGFRVIRSLLGEREQEGKEPVGLKFLFKYSWGRGGVSYHDQRKLIEVDSATVTSPVLSHAVQCFLVWFAEAEAMTYGRLLQHFEVWSEDDTRRLAEFRTYLTDWADKPSQETKYRPIGQVPGVSKQLFLNGVISVHQTGECYVVTVQEENGSGRELTLPHSEASALRELIVLNRQPEWHRDQLLQQVPERIETKGRDYHVKKIDIVAYDSTSKTVLCTYLADSGKLIQLNMSTGTLMTLHEMLEQSAA